ncbi:hypothetical protein QQS21_001283 [Conoideocrella luteorostrata]|uniref:N-acetyltransferase domain-containing protein n=1 Tax=Conoideocrella luteorostrata TaxID=1105319 RepID=A0AAJ0CX89_9HYPO|nr:hypothetical protein QQS21_001283 [Conoideocrella luteorostrata]
MSIKTEFQSRTWEKGGFFISTNPNLIPISTVIEIFDSDEFYWAKTLPLQAAQEAIDNSLSFGMYEQDPAHDLRSSTSPLKLVGMARCVTDFITFVYLTDVWVDPMYQGKGLGSWLVQCVGEALEAMPHLRRTVLFTADWERSVPFYQKHIGMTLIESQKGEGLAVMESKGKGHPSHGFKGTGYR